MAKTKHNSPKPQTEKHKVTQTQHTPSTKGLEEQGFFQKALNHRNWHILLIFFLSVFIYANTWNFKFAQDDGVLIKKNRFVKQGFAGIKDILTHDSFEGFFKEGEVKLSGGRYRPLTIVMFAIETELFGTPEKDVQGNFVKNEKGITLKKYSTSFGHIVNILLYGLLCVCIYIWLSLLFNPQSDEKNLKGFLIPLFATVLFATHPLHTEAVANIKGRDEIMSMMGAVLAAYWTLKAYYNKEKQILYFLGATIAFILGMMAKETPATFLAVIPMTFFFFVKTEESLFDFGKKIALYTLPLAVVFVIYWVGIRGQVVGASLQTGTLDLELMNNPFLRLEKEGYFPISGMEKLAIIFYTWLKYIQLLFFPHPLTHDYYPRHIPLMDFSEPLASFSVLLHLALLGYALYRLPKKDVVSFGILYYFATFSIVSNLIFPIGTNMGERFMFMPSIGFTLIISALLYHFLNIEKNANNSKAAFALVGIVAFFFSLKTINRNKAWESDLTLFGTDLHTSVNSAKVKTAYSAELIDLALTLVGNPAKQDSVQMLVNQVIQYTGEASKIHPNYPNPWTLRGVAFYLKKDYKNAIECYLNSDRLKPNQNDVRVDLGVTYRDWGKQYGEKEGNIPKALECLEKSYQYLNDDYETIRLLGVAYGNSKQPQKAAEMFEKYIARFPERPDGYMYASTAYRDLGNIAKSEELLKKGQSLMPPQPAK